MACLLQGGTEQEWREAAEAAAAIKARFPDLHEEMTRSRCVSEILGG
jgi:hypothetical protein